MTADIMSRREQRETFQGRKGHRQTQKPTHITCEEVQIFT